MSEKRYFPHLKIILLRQWRVDLIQCKGKNNAIFSRWTYFENFKVITQNFVTATGWGWCYKTSINYSIVSLPISKRMPPWSYQRQLSVRPPLICNLPISFHRSARVKTSLTPWHDTHVFFWGVLRRFQGISSTLLWRVVVTKLLRELDFIFIFQFLRDIALQFGVSYFHHRKRYIFTWKYWHHAVERKFLWCFGLFPIRLRLYETVKMGKKNILGQKSCRYSFILSI